MADDRFKYHAPSTTIIAGMHNEVRMQVEGLTHKLESMLPDCKELIIATRKLEEAMMWANAGIARHQNTVMLIYDRTEGGE